MIKLNHDHLTRQLDLINPDFQNKPLTIVGAGAIGSFLALNLAKAGWQDITVYDFDSVSVENMSNQFFRFSDIGKLKVQALQDLVFDFTNVKINAINEKLEPAQLAAKKGILFYCVDSMEYRTLFTQALGLSQIELVIDTRMSAEFLALYAFRPSSMSQVESYEKTLFTDSEAQAERCTAKSTVYTATLASALAVKVLKNFTMNEPVLKCLQWDIRTNQKFSIFEQKIN